MKIRVMLVDDHRMFREALGEQLRAAPDIEVVAEAATGAEAQASVPQARPDVLILDIALPDGNGIAFARGISRRYGEVRIIALSGYADRIFVQQMLDAGARGYVTKSAGAEELITAIRTVAKGEVFLCAEAARVMLHRVYSPNGTTNPPVTVLSRREQEVLCLLAKGRRSAEIGAELGIASTTADVHRRNIRRKLGLHTSAELTRYAIREGLLKT